MIKLILFATLALSLSACVTSSYYICTGDGAYAYHDNKKCRGLGNCKGSIVSVKEDEAKELGRSRCKICD